MARILMIALGSFGDVLPMLTPPAAAFGSVQELPWSIVPVFACATLSYYLVERPMIRMGHLPDFSKRSEENSPVKED